MSLAILFHFLHTQHVSDSNISIIRSLRLFCWITTSVVLFSVRCVLEIWCGWVWVVPVLQAEAQLSFILQLLQWCTVQYTLNTVSCWEAAWGGCWLQQFGCSVVCVALCRLLQQLGCSVVCVALCRLLQQFGCSVVCVALCRLLCNTTCNGIYR